MLQRINQSKAQATLEIVVVITAVLFAFLVFQKYIARGLMGRWKAGGDAFGNARQYDPNSSTACAFDFQFTNTWYDQPCYFRNNCDLACLSIYGDMTSCRSCIGGCGSAGCT